MKSIKNLIIIIIILIILLNVAHLVLQKRLYQIISRETLVGTIRCARSPDKNYDFYLFYFPGATEKKADFKFLKSNGRDWIFEGEIIKWKRPLNALGLKTAHRPIRIYDSRGNYLPLEEPAQKIAFKIERILPGIDTSFVSALRQPFAPRQRFGIYATNTGYMVRRIR